MSSTLPSLGGGASADEGHHGGPHLHKTLWEGTKNFWRTRENVDVRIIEHTDANALEIIGFSVDRHEEADRVFLCTPDAFRRSKCVYWPRMSPNHSVTKRYQSNISQSPCNHTPDNFLG